MASRFPTNEIPSLYRGQRRYNLTESTTRDLNLGELIDLIGLEPFRSLSLAYAHTGEGDANLRNHIAALVQVPAEHIVTTQGSAFGLYLAAASIGQSGSKGIIHAPYFQLTYNGLAAFDWEIAVVQNRFDDRYRLNLQQIEERLDGDVRLVTVASPQNPSGVYIRLEDLQALLDMMQRKAPDALLLVDETYREAAYTAEAILPSAAGLGPNVITCGSMSKAYGVPGLRAGWLTIPDAGLREEIITAKENIVICDSILTETLAAAVLAHRETILADQRLHLAKPLAMVKAWQRVESGLVEWVEPEAGALCCMRLNQDRFDQAGVEQFWRALAESDTLVRSGLQFGSDTRHFRLGFGHIPTADLEIGLDNLSKALRHGEIN